jgi:hypothetical protein
MAGNFGFWIFDFGLAEKDQEQMSARLPILFGQSKIKNPKSKIGGG